MSEQRKLADLNLGIREAEEIARRAFEYYREAMIHFNILQEQGLQAEWRKEKEKIIPALSSQAGGNENGYRGLNG